MHHISLRYFQTREFDMASLCCGRKGGEEKNFSTRMPEVFFSVVLLPDPAAAKEVGRRSIETRYAKLPLEEKKTYHVLFRDSNGKTIPNEILSKNEQIRFFSRYVLAAIPLFFPLSSACICHDIPRYLRGSTLRLKIQFLFLSSSLPRSSHLRKNVAI